MDQIEDIMTNATMHREFNPARSPFLGVAAVFATALTIGVAILLPTISAPREVQVIRVAAAPIVQPTATPAVAQVVILPAVDVVGTRPIRAAANNRYNVPAVLKQKG
jgi:hypothetical protein